MPFIPTSYDSITHHYAPRLIAIEHKVRSPDVTPQNLIIWIHGLGDGLLTVPYPLAIAKALPESWSLAEVLLSSSYGSWGTSSLKSDARDISKCVKYFHPIRTGRIVLMGHSTGCQDVMEYLVGQGHESRPAVDGAILQAPIGDREAILVHMSRALYDRSVVVAQAMVAAGKGEEIVPTSETLGIFGAPVSARRWLSLLSPNRDGEDDYFGSYLEDSQLERTFGAIPSRTILCILYSGADEHVPTEIDKASLVKRWIGFVKGRVDGQHSGVLEGACHNLKNDPEPVVADLVRRVLGFIGGLRSTPSL